VKPTDYFYLSGPMRGIEDFNYPAFQEAAKILRGAGYNIVNPAENHDGRKDLPRHEYFRQDIPQVVRSAGVILLPGWEDSQGAQLEVAVARACGLSVQEYYNRNGWPQLTMITAPVDHEDGGWTPPIPMAIHISEVMEQATPELYPSGTNPANDAINLVHGDRQEAYGHPYDDFSKTAAMWTAITGAEITPEMVAMMMVCVKISRHLNRPKRDNIVDGIGYWLTLDMVEEERQRRSA